MSAPSGLRILKRSRKQELRKPQKIKGEKLKPENGAIFSF